MGESSMEGTAATEIKVLIAGYPHLTENYQAAIRGIGCTPIVSLLPKQAVSTSSIAPYDGLLLPGGSDIEPSFFGEENLGSRDIDKALDSRQFALLDAFLKAGKPVLGICKGMQLINVYFGGTLIQNLPAAGIYRHAFDEVDKIHAVWAVPGTCLEKIYGKQIYTNSAHHQSIGRLGHSLLRTQYCEDGIVEALCHETLPVTGVQWHPERMGFANKRSDTADGEALFYHFKALLFAFRKPL